MKVGIVGIGWWSDVLAGVIAKSDMLDVRACFTRSQDKAVGFAAKFDCEAMPSYEAMLALDDLAEETLAFMHEGASNGVVSVDPDACTLCAQCAQTCPTDAIAASYDGSVVALSFAAASCTNCRQCTIACPEIALGAISVSSTVDAGWLRSERSTINQGTVLVCEKCGKPIAPSSMMERIGELLGDGFGDTMSYLNRRCLDCRGLT